jgi:hypothetical protein
MSGIADESYIEAFLRTIKITCHQEGTPSSNRVCQIIRVDCEGDQERKS